MTWHPATTAPADRRFWALRHKLQEVHPAQLGSTVGMGDPRLTTEPDMRFVVHARTGQGFFAKWWREIDLPEPQMAKVSGNEVAV